MTATREQLRAASLAMEAADQALVQARDAARAAAIAHMDLAVNAAQEDIDADAAESLERKRARFWQEQKEALEAGAAPTT